MMDKGKKDGMMLAIGIGKPKPGSEAPEEDTKEDSGEDFREFSDAAFDALKSDDKDAFEEAFRGAVEYCMGEY